MPEIAAKADPARVATSADLARELRLLKVWAGDPSLRTLARRIGVPASTLSDALGETRPLPRLPVLRAIVEALTDAPVDLWEAAWRRARATGLGAPETTVAAPVVPRQLPPATSGFVGRDGLLRRLDDLLDPETRPPAAILSALTGSGGVGKTALAVHWGHTVADRFPDGQLYVDLAGFGPGGPREATEVHGLFLRGLGVPASEIPADPDARLALYRSSTAGRALLVVLDNAATPEQVRPLLPTGRGCFTVVTTRHAFTGLRARDGAVRLYVDLLTHDEALALLAELVGERATAEPEAALAFVTACSRLPLAIRVAAQHAADRPGETLAALVADLTSGELDFFADPGDPHSDARAVFSWSLDRLDAPAAELFALLGLHPGRRFDVHSAAALAGIGHDDAEQRLAALLHAHLIDETATPERYSTHDLLRAYAAELAATLDCAIVTDSRERLADYYLHTVANASVTEHPWDAIDRDELPGSPAHARRFGHAAEATAWLDGELDDIVAVAVHAAGHGRPAHAERFSGLLWRRLHLRSHHDHGLTLHRAAFDAADLAGDDKNAGATAFRIGDVHWRVGEYERAETWFTRARDRKRAAGDEPGLGHALSGLGTVQLLTGRLTEARDSYRECRELAARSGNPGSEGVAIHNLAEVCARLGEHEEAARRFREALDLAVRHGLKDLRVAALIGTAVEGAHIGDPAAETNARQALDLARDLGSRDMEAQALTGLGVVLGSTGRRAEATGHLRRALRMFTELGNAAGRAEAAAALAGVE
ncbi:hypothetical protein Afil01_17060 [Actinorhabdospora filicis]|uniref:Tetratricopeptide repeat protein n=1 Tax=Actinorhabdospora filicis TaxID=1785913 RepID=A0A9W6SJS5_9ACTN|nr:tetratricopeptide repeat protein [Actinorhabdospora filicis]GLZ76899.1 hypothetical protein Afil01_17060 [Actinorhabdospora filicis]